MDRKKFIKEKLTNYKKKIQEHKKNIEKNILLKIEEKKRKEKEDEEKEEKENLLKFYSKYPDCEFLKKFVENYDVFLDIYKKCDYKFWYNCGSYLFDGKSYKYCEKMYEKQKLLYEASKKSISVLEIGVYMGHSLFIMLLANPKIKITCVDIDDTYSIPAINILENKFSTNIKFIKNNSIDSINILNEKFDMFHIDGEHSELYVKREFELCLDKIYQKNAIFVFDDYDVFPEYINSIAISNEKYDVINFNISKCSWNNAVVELKILN